MSLSSLALEELAFLALTGIAVGSALIAVQTRYAVYSAVALGMTGAGVAGLMALLGFGYVAAFHLLVYVGATVTFMAFSVIMLREQPGMLKNLVPLAVVSAILICVTVIVAVNSMGIERHVAPVEMELREAAEALVDKYWFPLILAIVSLATIMIEGISVARGDEE